MLKRNEQVAPVDHPLKSQTFPEGKGVETSWDPASAPRVQAPSQTFPEGKGVETLPGKSRYRPGFLSQTFPEGKGVETPRRPAKLRS